MVRLLPGNIIDLLFGGDQTATRGAQAAGDASSSASTAPTRSSTGAGSAASSTATSASRSATREPISDIMSTALPITLELVFLGLLIAVARSACRSASSRPSSATALPTTARGSAAWSGISIPSFWLATLLLLFTSRVFHWVPPLTYISLCDDPIGNLEPVHPAGDLDLGLHAGDRDAHGARDDARGARPGLRPHRPGEGRRRRTVISQARAAERPDPGGHDRRLRDRRADRRRRDRRDHLRAARRRLHASAGDLQPRLPGHPGGDADHRRSIFIFANLLVDILYGVLDPRIAQE